VTSDEALIEYNPILPGQTSLCGADTYRVAWCTKLDGGGREFWRRLCVVWMERDA
jgi:hypothetical protein